MSLYGPVERGYQAMGMILTVRETAEILRVTEKTVRKWLRAKTIPGRRLGRLWRINEEELIQSIKSGWDDG